VVLPPGSKLDPVLLLTNSIGNVIEERSGAFSGLLSVESGTYAVGVRDKEYRGGTEFTYRLQIGNLPVVTSYFPLGVQRGQSVEVHIDGVNLGKRHRVTVTSAATAGIGSRIPVPVKSDIGSVLNAPSLVVGEFPEMANDEAFSPHVAQVLALPVPGT